MTDIIQQLTEGKIRYRLTFGSGSLSFSAKQTDDLNELGEILREIADALQGEKKRIIGECTCGAFLVEGEHHLCEGEHNNNNLEELLNEIQLPNLQDTNPHDRNG